VTKILLIVAALAISPEESAKHKQWMDYAQDLKEDVRDAIEANAPERATTPTDKLVSICQQEVTFWTKAELPDVRQRAEQNLAVAQQMGAAAKASDLARTKAAFHRLEESCKACHDLHPEKRLNGKEPAR
jgi:hypothetical protein